MDNIDLNQLLFQFDGRINRAKFWIGAVILYVAFGIIVALFISIDNGAARTVLGLLYVALIWPGLAVQIKRWHDRDKSGWWVLIGLIPIIGGLWALVETGFLEGTKGPNQYGPDPLGGVADDMAM